MLGEGQRRGLIAIGRKDSRQGAAARLGQYLGHGCQLGIGKQVAQQQLHTQALTDLRDHAHRQQRMPAQFEEVITTPHALHLQHIGPDLRQYVFDLAFRRHVLAGKHCGHVRRRQGLVVELAIGGQGQRVQLHVGDRHHVVRQVRHQMGADIADGQRVELAVFGEIRHQPLVTHQHHGFLDSRQLVELGFDFAQFNAHATDLHLVVIAPQVLDVAVRQPACEVAGAVHAPGVERVVQETLGSQLRAVQVTARHAFSAHVQLPRYAQRHWLLLLIQQVHGGVGHGFADVQRLAGFDLAGGGDHCGFGRPIVVDQVETLGATELAQAITTDQQRAQRRVFELLAERVLGHRRGQEAHVQRLRTPPGQQCVDILGAVMGRWQVQGRAHAQRRPDFPGHRVKAEPGDAGSVAPGAQVKGAAMPVHQVDHGMVLDHHALGQPGGTGGVDHIGQVGRRDRHLGVARRMVLPGVAVEVDHRHFQGRQARQQGVLGQHRHRRAVAEQVVEALGRVGRVHRHIAGAGLENRQQAGQGVQAATGDDGDAVVGLDPQRQQVMGQQVGLLVEFGIGELAALMHGGNGVGAEHRLGFDARVQRVALGEIRLGGIEVLQQQTLLVGGNHCHLIQRGMRRLSQRRHQMVEGGLQVGADALRVDLGGRQQPQDKPFAEVIDAQGQRVVGTFIRTQGLDALPRRHRFAAGAGAAVAIIEQRAEQRCRRQHPAATLCQGQRRVFVAQQAGEARMGGLDRTAQVVVAHIHAKRQGVDEDAQGTVRGVPALHAPHQHSAEHHLGLAGQHTQHPRPAQVEQTGDADPKHAGLGAQALVEGVCQRPVEFIDATAIALHILQAEGQGWLQHIAEHLLEEHFVLLLADPQARLRHVAAKRHGVPQLPGVALQQRLHFMAHHFQRTVVQGHVMEQQHGDDALLCRVVGPGQTQHGRLGHVEAVMAGVETCMQLGGDIAVGRVQFQRLHRQRCRAPHHLRGLLQAVPDHAGTQDVMPVHHPLQGLGKRLETLDAVEGELRLHHIGVALLGADVVEQNAFLQRRQWVDVLDIRHPAVDGGDDPVDLVLAQLGQGQHRRCDVCGASRDAIGRHLVGRRVVTGLDQLDQRRFVFAQGGEDQRVAQRLLVALH
ncbi:hypothetical protein ALQ17_05351 [Pseudomonas fluorescens]|nr:hypothetical protein ALQ17_05351 [Pseudomonas fluorescens]